MNPLVPLASTLSAALGLTALLLFAEDRPSPAELRAPAAAAAAPAAASVVAPATELPSLLESAPAVRQSVDAPSGTAVTANEPSPEAPEARPEPPAATPSGPATGSGNGPQDSGDWMTTSRAIARRLGTPEESFAGAALDLGRFVREHSIDVDALGRDELDRLDRHYTDLWDRRVQELQTLAEPDVTTLLRDPAAGESDATAVEATEARYRALENSLAEEFLPRR